MSHGVQNINNFIRLEKGSARGSIQCQSLSFAIVICDYQSAIGMGLFLSTRNEAIRSLNNNILPFCS